MPKVYFEDTGLRNYLTQSFLPWGELSRDSGPLLENIFWRQWSDQYAYDDIRYRRTSADQEVDFVLQEQMAFEIKVHKDRFQKSKYKVFVSSYPQISLQCVDLSDALK